MSGMFGIWFWWIVASLLLIGELLLPGVFLIWLAAAAAFTAIVALLTDFGWQGEIITFCLASLVTVGATWKAVRAKWHPESDQPNLNRRLDGYVGQSFVLEQPIVNGAGQLRIQDAYWDVTGPDMPSGRRVKVKSVDHMRLVVEPA
jgi:inner membrane protein